MVRNRVQCLCHAGGFISQLVVAAGRSEGFQRCNVLLRQRNPLSAEGGAHAPDTNGIIRQLRAF